MLVMSSYTAEHSPRSESGGCTMRTAWIAPRIAALAALAACVCAAQSGMRNFVTSQSMPNTSASSDGLVCKISLKELQWHRSESVEMTAVIDNHSENPVRVRVVPSLTLKPLAQASNNANLDELSYIALWDIRKGASLPLSTTVQLELKTGQSSVIASDISELLWSRVNWSVLPHSKLFDVVPTGRYLLHLELGTTDGKVLCSSNPLNVLVN
jgi:hypothetical protein